MAGVSTKTLLQMETSARSKKKEVPSLRDIRAMSRGDAASTLKSLVDKDSSDMDVNRVLDRIYSLPLITIDNVKFSQQAETTTTRKNTTGKLNLDLVICSKSDNNRSPLTLAVVLGTPHHWTLLAHDTISIGHSGTVTKSVELSFDWSAANARSGESGGFVILRLLFEEIRGLDAQVALSLE